MMDKNRALKVEHLEERRLLTASLGWDGPGAGSAELTYHIGSAPSSLSQSAVDQAIETALNAWSDVVDIEFTRTSQRGLRDSLDFSFRNIDGRGGTLAQAYFPDDINPARIAGDVQFDVSDPWEIGNAQGSRAFDLVAVAVHEIGHALGLTHSHHADSILAPTISPNQQFVSLSQHDIEDIRELYAPADVTVVPDPVSPEVPPATPLEPPVTSARPDPDSSRDAPTETPVARSPWYAFRWRYRIGSFYFQWGGLSRMQAGSSGHNHASPTDVNNDSTTSPVDALLVINGLNSGKTLDELSHMCDTNNDGQLTPMDALHVVNVLNHEHDHEHDENDEHHHELESEDDHTEAWDREAEAELSEFGEHEFEDHELEDHGPQQVRLPLRWNEQIIDEVFAFFDDDANGAIEQEEVPSFAWRWATDRGLDADDDGSITRVEVDALVESIERDRLSRRFERRDENGDGELTSDEVPERVWNRIENADTDATEGVSLEEFIAFKQLGRFEQLDDNGDGSLTEDEVSSQLWQRIVDLDGDNSGSVSSEEFAAGLRHSHDADDEHAEDEHHEDDDSETITEVVEARRPTIRMIRNTGPLRRFFLWSR